MLHKQKAYVIQNISYFRQRLHETGSVWNRYEIGKDKLCVHTGPGGPIMDRICYSKVPPLRNSILRNSGLIFHALLLETNRLFSVKFLI